LFSVRIFIMPEAKKQTASKTRVDRLIESYAQTEERFSKVSKRKLILILVALSAVFVALGILLGVLLSPKAIDYAASTTASGDEIVSYSGIVRDFETEQNGASHYLERDSQEQILLRSSKIDLSFFEDSAVTVEGISIESAGGGSDILFVSKIRIK
jgi:hypothetical protein